MTENHATEHRTPYPVRVDARLEPGLSRWLWLVKWLLLLPHYIVLVFLWVAFVVLSVVAFVAILVTGRYPRALFDFNVGVLRWSWRVQYYGYAALGTDRYPPFTLADVPDYPARLDVPYPERLSRGLVLVKWWLLALPHYLVLAVFVGGGIWLGTRGEDGGWDDGGWGAGGLVGLLVLIAAIVLLFTGRYPQSLYDFVLGMNRWAFRVVAYAGLMTDRYPPFRLDMGGTDPGSVPAGPLPPGPVPASSGAVPGTVAAATAATAPGTPGGMPPAPAPPASHWSAGRLTAVITGAVLLFLSTGLLAGGGALLWADQTQRDGEYLYSPRVEIDSSRHAIVSDGIELHTDGAEWVLDDFLGTARFEVASLDPDTELFVGVARTSDVAEYLAGVGHDRIGDLGPGWRGGRLDRDRTTEFPGGAPDQAPTDVDIWVAEASGSGTQVLEWRPQDGTWTLVVMLADGTAGLDVEARIGATAPGLTWLAAGLLGVGGVLLLAGALLVVLAARRAQHGPPPGQVPAVSGPPPGPPSGPPPGPPAGPAGPAPGGPALVTTPGDRR